MGEILFLLILLSGGVFLYFDTFSFITIKFLDPVMGPAKFPQILLIILIVGIVLLMAKKLWKKEKQEFVFLELFKGTRLVFGLLMLLYVCILKYLGFIISTAIFLMLSTTYLYYIEHKIMPLKATVVRFICIVAFSVCIYWVMSKYLGVLLPRGMLLN